MIYTYVWLVVVAPVVAVLFYFYRKVGRVT